MNADPTTDDTEDEDFTWVSGDHGPRLSAWTCAAADCNGGLACSRRDMTHWHGSPEDVALHHAAGSGSGRVHVFDSGRVYTFKTWRTMGLMQSREVL